MKCEHKAFEEGDCVVIECTRLGQILCNLNDFFVCIHTVVASFFVSYKDLSILP